MEYGRYILFKILMNVICIGLQVNPLPPVLQELSESTSIFMVVGGEIMVANDNDCAKITPRVSLFSQIVTWWKRHTQMKPIFYDQPTEWLRIISWNSRTTYKTRCDVGPQSSLCYSCFLRRLSIKLLPPVLKIPSQPLNRYLISLWFYLSIQPICM